MEREPGMWTRSVPYDSDAYRAWNRDRMRQARTMGYRFAEATIRQVRHNASEWVTPAIAARAEERWRGAYARSHAERVDQDAIVARLAKGERVHARGWSSE
jgi:hypothetical protein